MPTLHLAVDARKGRLGFNEFNKAADSTQKRASAVKKAVAGIFAGFTAAIVVRDMVKVNAGFESTMSTLQAVTGIAEKTDATFKNMMATARELGATTRFSAREAGEGMVFLARAGFEANEIISAIPATLNLAAAGALGLGEAADYASNILSQFNLAATETERVADVLVTTANSSNTSVVQLAEAMKMAGPVAGALGISIEQTAAAIGVLGDSGIQASLAGTNLRGTFAALLGPTSAAQRALKGMGLTLDEIDPASHDLIEVFGRFADKTLSAADAVEIFGRRNAAAALIMTANVNKMKELTEANEKAERAAAKAAKTMDDNLSGAFKALRSSIEEAYIQIGDEGLTGGLRSMVDVSTEALRIILGLSDGTNVLSHQAKTLITLMKTMTATFATFIAMKIGLYLKGMAVQMALFVTEVKALAAANVAMNMYNLSATAAAGSTSVLAIAMTRLKVVMINHPILLAATAVAALGTAFALLSDHVDETAERIKVLRESATDIDDLAGSFDQLRLSYEKSLKKDLGEKQVIALEAMARNMENAIEDIREGLTSLGKETISVAAFASYEGVFDAEAMKHNYITALKKAITEAGSAADVKSVLADAAKLTTIDFETIVKPPPRAGGAIGWFDLLRNRAIAALNETEVLYVRSDDALESMARSLGSTNVQIKQLKGELKETADHFQELADNAANVSDARKELEGLVSTMRAEREAIGQTTEEMERQALAEQVASETAGMHLIERIKWAWELNAAYEQLNKTRKKAEADTQVSDQAKSYKDLVDSLKLEQGLIGATNEERRLAILQANKHLNLTERQTANIRDQLEETRRLTQLADAAEGISDAFGSAIEDAIFDFKSLEDIAENVLEEISRMIVRTFAIDPLMNSMRQGLNTLFGVGGGGAGAAAGIAGEAELTIAATTLTTAGTTLTAAASELLVAASIMAGSEASGTIGKIGSLIPGGGGGGGGAATVEEALGGIFNRGRIVPFGMGGIFDGPTHWPLADGNTALAGEAGPEAAMPLIRTSSGHLGVRAENGQQNNVVNHHYNMRVTTPNADSFRRSEKQIRTRLKRTGAYN